MEEKAISIYRYGVYIGNLMVDSNKQFTEEEFDDLVDKVFGLDIRKIERDKEGDETLLPIKLKTRQSVFHKIINWLNKCL